jgi:hypothetical protein
MCFSSVSLTNLAFFLFLETFAIFLCQNFLEKIENTWTHLRGQSFIYTRVACAVSK